MKNSFRCNIFHILFLLTAVMAGNYVSAQSISSQDVEVIRQRNLLRAEDMETIKNYVKQELTSMLDARDPSDKITEVAEINQSLSPQKDVKDMYSNEYTKAVLESVTEVQSQLTGMEDKEKANAIYIHTIQAIANTDNPLATDALLGYASNEDLNIRYFAIEGLSKPAITEYFSSDNGQATYKKVADGLKAVLNNETSPEVIGIIAEAAVLTSDTGIDLISSCVAKRASQYKSWNGIGNEMVDYHMMSKIISVVRSGVNADFKRKDASLMAVASEIYNLAWQRYYLGSKQIEPKSGEEYCIFNNTPSKSNLLTILVEGEKALASLTADDSSLKMTGGNLLRNSWQVLEKRVDKLVGLHGLVNDKFDIYGNKTETGLTTLPEPPAEMLENALNLAKLDKMLLEVEF